MWVLVASGGAAGATVRWLIGEFHWSSGATLLVVNALGSGGLGLIVARRVTVDRVRVGAGIGFCGGLTTFSTLAVEVAHRIDTNQVGHAATLLASCFVGAGITFGIGYRVARPR